MTTEVEKFDPSKLMDGVRDRIKATFVSLIPDAQWDDMVKKETDRFFEPKEGSNYYNNKKPSDFQNIVNEELMVVTKKKLSEYLNKKYETKYWSGGGLKASKALEKFILENSDKILLSVIGGMTQQMVSEMQNRMQSNLNNNGQY